MTHQEATVLWAEATRGLAAIEQSLPPQVLAQLTNLKDTMWTIISGGGGAAAFRPVFQEFWKISLNQVRNVNLLKAMQPFIRPALGFWATNWARVEICCLAISGALTAELFLGVMLGILVAAIVIAFLMLLLWLWNRGMQVPQGPGWQPLFQAVHSPTIGPIYTINTGNTPSLIELPNAT